MFSSNTSQVVSATQAEAIDYDGTNDYLSRASDLIGNADGKTFTFSAWIYKTDTAAKVIYRSGGGTVRFNIGIDSSSRLTLAGWNAAGTVIFDVTYTPIGVWSQNTFFHVLCSVDLTNTANRALYVNDVNVSPTWGTYINDSIEFTTASHTVAAQDTSTSSTRLSGRLSNVYLDYTYRDLSVTANRRLFITADLKPASGQAALNPILYLPMNDPTAPGTNAGTGGNFTLTGTVARSGRGPNQYNAPYSDLDGAADFLSRTTNLTGASNSSAFTLAFVFNVDILTAQSVFIAADLQSGELTVEIQTNNIEIVAKNTSGSQALNVGVPFTIVAGRNYHFLISLDLTSTATRFVYVNGIQVTPTWTTYINSSIRFQSYTDPRWRVGVSQLTTPTKYLNGRLGALWFNTSYIDLSVATNLAKFVTGTGIDAKPVDLGASGELPTGTSPLIYLPMYGNNAGKNYGTGGDFTVNSGPYTGARGPNEFWGNKADFNGTTGYLSRTSALSGLSDSKTISGCLWFNADDVSNDPTLFEINTGAGIQRLFLTLDSATTGRFRVYATNASNTAILNLSASTTLATVGTTFCVLFCFDLTDTALRRIYINDVNQTLSVSAYTNDLMDLTTSRYDIGAAWNGATAVTFFNGRLSEFYFTTDYIDFSQEANRLKFRDAFGNPTDLPSAITAQSVPNPAIYMRFPPTAFGTNSGTGGDFTVNGTISDGGQL